MIDNNHVTAKINFPPKYTEIILHLDDFPDVGTITIINAEIEYTYRLNEFILLLKHSKGSK